MIWIAVHSFLRISITYPLGFMRVSPLRHPLAVLRNILGLNQKEMGQVAGCSSHTIQAVELKNLQMSEDLALRIATSTGISAAWLLAGDPATSPVTNTTPEQPYTKEVYELLASGRVAFHTHPLIYAFHLYSHVDLLDAILVNAVRNGKFPLARHRLEKFVEQMESDFGYDEVTLANHTARKKIAETIVAEADPTLGEALLAEMSKLTKESEPHIAKWWPKRTISIDLPIHDYLAESAAEPPMGQTTATKKSKAPRRKKSKVS